MNLSGLSELLLAWAKSQGTALLGQDKSAPQGFQFQPGREYDAKVLDSLPTGRHLVQVAGQKLDMPLPRNTQPGESLRLTYLGGGTRPTFLLNQTAQAQSTNPAQPVSLSSTAQQVSALSRLAGPSAAVNVGGAGLSGPVSNSPNVGTPNAVSPGQVNESGESPGSAGLVRGPAGPLLSAEAVARPPVMAGARAEAALGAAGQGGLSSAARPPIAEGVARPSATLPQPAQVGANAPGRPIATLEMLSSPGPGGVRSAATPTVAQHATNPLPAAVVSATGRPIAANVVMLNTASSAMPLAPGGAVSPNTALVGQAVEGARAAVPSSTTLRPNVLAELPGSSRNMLPTRLFQTLSESGLFYESHLSRWAKGELSFDALLREPQARLGRELPLGARVAELGGMPDEVARLAGRQLQLLDGAPLVWQGFAWPGQWMEWLVEERYPEGGEGGGEEEGERWVTELHLHLPRMGSVHAHIGLHGDHLDLRLTAQDPEVRETLQTALPALVKGLEAGGLKPDSLTVGLAHET